MKFTTQNYLYWYDRLRVGGAPREQKMLKGHLPKSHISPSILDQFTLNQFPYEIVQESNSKVLM